MRSGNRKALLRRLVSLSQLVHVKGLPLVGWVGLGLTTLCLLLSSACEEISDSPTPYMRPTDIVELTVCNTRPSATSVNAPTEIPAVIPSSTPTPTLTKTPPPTPILSMVCKDGVCQDAFNMLDESVWDVRPGSGISIGVNGGSLHARRSSTKTEDKWENAVVRLKELLDFTGARMTKVTWRMTIYPNAVSSLTYARLVDRGANRYLAFDCGVICEQTEYFECAIALRDFDGNILDSQGLGKRFVRGQYYNFKMVSRAPRHVEFFVDTQLVYSPTFSLDQWNGIDQVQAEWLVLAWPSNDDETGQHQCANVIHAALDHFLYQQK